MERFTIQRKIILDAVAHAGHARVKDIQEYVYSFGYSMSLATIYRNLDALVQEKMLTRISINLKDNYYEIGEQSPHSHFVCEKCHNIIDIPMDSESHIDYVDGNKVLTINTIYYGICKECLKKEIS